MMPRVFSVVEEFDANLIPLDSEQAARLLHENLPPVKYEDLSHYGDGDSTVSGFCPRHPQMPHLGGGEVVIDLGISQGTMYERARRRRLAIIYIHELAHRMVPLECHGPVFAAVCSALTLRALPHEGSSSKAISWYEVQDAENPGVALNHAIEFARAHKESGVPAKELPKLAEESWSQWRDDAWKALLAGAKASVEVDLTIANGNARASAASAHESSIAEANARRKAANLKRALEASLSAARAAHTLSWGNIAAVGIVCAFVGLLFGMGIHR